MKIVTFFRVILGLGALAGGLVGCDRAWNDPYPSGWAQRNVLYSAFTLKPKHLDPVQSYAEDEGIIHGQIYEPPLQYHYLKRPYTLEPLTVQSLPTVTYWDAAGHRLSPKTPPDQVAFSEYALKIKPGIRYQPHPAFAKSPTGSPLYFGLSPSEIASKQSISDFPMTGTRDLVAGDYVHQIKRLASPNLHSPIFELMAEYIVGLRDLQKTLETAQQKKGGPKEAWIDVSGYSLVGAQAPDDETLKIRIKGVYPQFQYWLAMSFFAPVPPEVDRFFGQPGMAERNLSLDVWPVGTGPYMMTENQPNARMVLSKNPYFHPEAYPCEGEPKDAAAGLLVDCNQPLPFVDQIIFIREPEAMPYWNKFLQGYYDVSGIAQDNFDQAVNLSNGGDATLSEDMQKKGINLVTSVSPSLFYMGVNMDDGLLGGLDEKHRKLRQALSLALDQEEFIAVFLNGRGVPAMSPIPPGVAGHPEGAAGVNPYLYTWENGRPVRKPLDEAKRLLKEAGWPDGRHAQTGEPLVVNLDTTATGMGDKAIVDWMTRQLRRVGVQLVVRGTDWNRFQEKLRTGNAQLFFMGWNADYPDPENFLFLLHGPQSRAKGAGENAANYLNPEYDALFERMKRLPDGAERNEVIAKMVALVQRDSPWLWGYYPKAYALQHGWLKNRKPTGNLIRNGLKYQKVDVQLRAQQRAAWNQPALWPLVLAGLGLAGLLLPAWLVWRRREKATARTS